MLRVLDFVCRLFGYRCTPPSYTVRVWTLGDLDHRIWPTQAAYDRLSKMLVDIHAGNGPHEIIWGPDLKVAVVKGEVTTLEPVSVSINQNGAQPQEQPQ